MPAPDRALTRASERRFIRQQARRRLGLAPAGLVALHVGRMAPRSGIDTIILGLALLRRYYGAGATLLVTDDDTGAPARAERARLRQLARELGIEAHVHFLAAQVGGDCHAAADVLIGIPWPARTGATDPPSRGWIRPTIATGTDEPAGPVIDGVNGWLVAPRDAATLAARLARLQRQPGLAPGADGACRARVPA